MAFDAKVTTTKNNDPTIALPIARQGLRYVSAETVQWPPVRMALCPIGSLADIGTTSQAMSALPPKRTCSYTSMRSINVGSSPAAFELFTLRDTGYICSDF